MILNEHSPSFCGAFESTRMRKCGRIKRFLQAFMFAISSIMVQGSRVSNNFNAAAALKHASLHHLTMGPRLENQCTMHLKLFLMQQFFRTEDGSNKWKSGPKGGGSMSFSPSTKMDTSTRSHQR
ncbi:hypothetical protein GmHk_13G037322 [Glycine max]|nr:hypothetical protein GmHk_13G037322 [Glycine max]